MSKYFLMIPLFFSAFLLTGCNTVKNTVTATCDGVYLIGKGIAADLGHSDGVVKRADDWFQEKYW